MREAAAEFEHAGSLLNTTSHTKSSEQLMRMLVYLQGEKNENLIAADNF